MPEGDYSGDLEVALSTSLGTAVGGDANDYTFYYEPTGWEGVGPPPTLSAPTPLSAAQVDIPANYSGVTLMAQLLASSGFYPTATISPSIQAASGYEVDAAVANAATASTTNPIPGELDVQTVVDGTGTGLLANNVKATTGAFVPLNTEDANHDGIADYKNPGPISGEVDLLNISLYHCTAPGAYSLTFPTNVRVWSDNLKTPKGQIISGKTLTIPTGTKLSLWVEGVAQGPVIMHLLYRPVGGARQLIDEINPFITTRSRPPMFLRELGGIVLKAERSGV